MEKVGGGEGADLDEFAWEKGGLQGNGWRCGGEGGGGCGEFGLEEIAELGEGGVHGVRYCSIEQFNIRIQSCKGCCGGGGEVEPVAALCGSSSDSLLDKGGGAF